MVSRLRAPERRELLLDAAAAIFSERGYAGATTSQISRAAGVTEPIIYRHFESKRALFVALIDRTSRRTVAAWESQLACTASPADRLSRLVGANPMTTDEGRGAHRLVVQAMMRLDDEHVVQALRRHIGLVHGFLSAEIAKAQASGHTGVGFSADLIAWMLVEVGLGYGVLAPLGCPGHGHDASGASVRQAIEALLLEPRTRGTSSDAGHKQ